MLHPNYITPTLLHLTVQQMRKLDIVVPFLFPSIPQERLLKLLTTPELVEELTNPHHIPSLDEVSGSSQTFEDILRGLTDDQTSVDDFRSFVETHGTRLADDPVYREMWARVRHQLTDESSYTKAQEFSDSVIDQLRNENPELVREVEAYVETLSGMFKKQDPEVNTGVEGESAGPNSSDATSPGAVGEIEVENVNAEVFESTHGIGNVMQTAEAGAWVGIQEVSWRADISILGRIIWRNLKNLRDFHEKVEKLQGDVKSLNQEYENGTISPETYELRSNEALRELDRLFPETISDPLDTIYPSWKSKVLGIKEEHRPVENNTLSANPEPSGEELAEAFIEPIAAGDLYCAAAVDYVAASTTESESESFLTAIQAAVSNREVGEPSGTNGNFLDMLDRHSSPAVEEPNLDETEGTEGSRVAPAGGTDLNRVGSPRADAKSRSENEVEETQTTWETLPVDIESGSTEYLDNPEPTDSGNGDDGGADIAAVT